MIHWRRGRVRAVTGGWGDVVLAEVDLDDGGRVPAQAQVSLVGRPEPGDTALLNVSALRRGLGTGGYALVVALPDRLPADPVDGAGADPPGHVVKARYTPLQTMVLSLEEQESPLHEAMRTHPGVVAGDLGGMPVVAAELHSALPAVVAAVHADAPGARVAYVMTDSGALPLGLSALVAAMSDAGMLATTITAGQAFGGEHEAITVHSALLAARHVLGCDLAVVTQGPGNAGSATAWGYSGLSQGEVLNAAHTLRGRGVAVARVSDADPRGRHRGLSHHAGTTLGRAVLGAVDLPVPADGTLSPEVSAEIDELVTSATGELRRVDVPTDGLDAALRACPVPLRTMGRDYGSERAAFVTAAAAGRHAAALAGAVSRP